MYALNFEFDGTRLSDFGFIVCDFDNNKGFVFESSGSVITFNKVPYKKGKRHILVDSKYEECIQMTFGICKNPDIFDDLSITNDEYRDLVRWLNRNEFLPFSIIYEDSSYHEQCIYYGSFNIEKVKVSEILYGLKLTFESDKPFGFAAKRIEELDFLNTESALFIRDASDEIGYIYPKITIHCMADGDYVIKNNFTNSCTKIRNCKDGERITIDSDNHIISSSFVSHDIYNSFNYDYFSIGNSVKNRNNEITVNLPCKLIIEYCPIIKDSV